ncbi:hypothetical protein BKA64DRAFT_326891 [Cadophora sp. MPI-SDFR-AT-0126]|nr:hypothetical protein BKA64DRAFT_326891 [Leotiomycetes sp. MPI-SDFR-AT-0126]
MPSWQEPISPSFGHVKVPTDPVDERLRSKTYTQSRRLIMQLQLVTPSMFILAPTRKSSPSLKHSITIKGSAYPATNPSSNLAHVTYATYASAVGSNDASATLLINNNNFKMYNMNITNSAGTASQAVAVSARGCQRRLLLLCF